MAAPPPAKSTPKDAQVMMAILKDMGVTDYEPRVVNQMLEFTFSKYFSAQCGLLSSLLSLTHEGGCIKL